MVLRSILSDGQLITGANLEEHFQYKLRRNGVVPSEHDVWSYPGHPDALHYGYQRSTQFLLSDTLDTPGPFLVVDAGVGHGTGNNNDGGQVTPIPRVEVLAPGFKKYFYLLTFLCIYDL